MRDRTLSFESNQLTPNQLAKIAARQKNANNFATRPKPPAEEWDPNFDESTEALFGRVWQDEDFRPDTAMRLREVLGWHLIGNDTREGDLPLLASVVRNSWSQMLRDRATAALNYYKVHNEREQSDAPQD